MDVRKMRNELLGKRLVAALESRNMEAVSYTHLDVYKRQQLVSKDEAEKTLKEWQ